MSRGVLAFGATAPWRGDSIRRRAPSRSSRPTLRLVRSVVVLALAAAGGGGCAARAPAATTVAAPGVAASAPATACAQDETSLAIDAALAADAARATPWNVGWGIGYGVAAIGQAAVAGFAGDRISDAQRTSLWIGAGKATIGAGARVVRPIRIEPAAPCSERATQRRALAVAARRERNNIALNFFGGLALNTAGLLYLGLARDAWREGAIAFGIGTAVGVVSIYTAPREAFHLDRRLR